MIIMSLQAHPHDVSILYKGVATISLYSTRHIVVACGVDNLIHFTFGPFQIVIEYR